MGVQRHCLNPKLWRVALETLGEECGTSANDDGLLVKYEDHARVVAEKDARIAELEAADHKSLLMHCRNYLRSAARYVEKGVPKSRASWPLEVKGVILAIDAALTPRAESEVRDGE